MTWVAVEDRLPEFGRPVKVWGEFCADGVPAPVAYRRREPNGARSWYWSSTEARGSNGIFWWWDGPARAVVVGYRPLAGPGDPGYAGGSF